MDSGNECERKNKLIKLLIKYLAMLYDKKMDIDYEILESQDFQNKQKYAVHWILEWSEPMDKSISSLGIIGACIIGMIMYGTALAMQSILILIFISISVMVTVIMMSKALSYENETWKKTTKSRRKMGYINNQAMDFAAEKDIRLFGMQEWFMKMYHSFSSCRFCSDIIVFDDGNLIQRGSHEKLITKGWIIL